MVVEKVMDKTSFMNIYGTKLYNFAYMYDNLHSCTSDTFERDR